MKNWWDEIESIWIVWIVNECGLRWPPAKPKSIPIPFFENEWIGLICLLSSLAAWMELIGGALGSFVVGYRRLAAIMLRKRETSAPTIQGWVIEKLNCLNGMRTNQSFHFTWGERANASRCKPKQHQQIKWIFMGMKFIDLWFVWWGAATQQLINSSFHLINQQHKDKKLSFVGLIENEIDDCWMSWLRAAHTAGQPNQTINEIQWRWIEFHVVWLVTAPCLRKLHSILKIQL